MRTYSIYSKLFITQSITQLWDLIETCGFCEDVKDIKEIDDDDNDNDNNEEKVKDKDKYDNKDEDGNKGISALRLDIDLVCIREHLGHIDGNNDNDNNDDKDDDNNNNNNKNDISAW